TNGTPISTPPTRRGPMRWSMRSPPAPGSSKFRIGIVRLSGSTGAAKLRGFLGSKRNAECFAKAALSVGGNFQCTRIADARDPAEFEAAAGKRCAERARKMQPALAPIDAGPAERAAAALDVLEMDTEVGEEFLARARDHAAVFAEHDVFIPRQRVGECNAEPAGDMVVAGARGAQLLAAVPARTITLRRVGGDHHDAFDHARDLRRPELEITMPALLGHRQEIRRAQHGE